MPDAPSSIATFTVRGGPLDRQRLDVDEQVDDILIGSDTDCRFCLDLPGVSPIHARVWIDLDGVTVHDTHSPRGVYVNDNRVTGQAPLRDRDILWLGPPGDASSVMIECRFASAAADASAGDAAAGPISAGDALADLMPGDPASTGDAFEEFVRAEPDAGDALAELVPAEDVLEEAAPAEDALAEPAPAPAEAGSRHLQELLGSEPAASPASGFDFFVDEPPAEPPPPAAAPAPSAIDDLLLPEPAAPAVPGARAVPPPPAVNVAPAEDEFFVEEAAVSADAAPASAEGDPASDGFFVEETPPAVIFDEPFALEEEPAAAPTMVEPPPLPVTRPPSPATPPPPPATQPAAAATPAPPEPRRTPRPVPPPSRPRPPRAQPAAAPPAAPPRAAAPTRGGVPPMVQYGVLAAVVLLVLGGIALLVSRSTRAPKLESVNPARVGPGQTLILTGQDFAPQPQGNVVRFEGRPARVLQASATQLQVEVPDVPTIAGRPSQVAVTVSVGGRESAPAQVTVFQSPRIHGLSPNVAMPGEEVTLAGTGWGMGAKVRFGSTEAPVLAATATTMRVRVPEAAGGVGTSIPVVVSMGSDASNPFPFLLGRLPLVTGVEPRTVSPGDVVAIAGRGFHIQPASNAVKIGGAPALVVSSIDSEVKAIVPRGAAPGAEAPLEVKVAGLDNVGQATITVSPPLDPVEFGFAAEQFTDAAGHEHAVLTTGLGPAFVLSASGRRSAAERGLEAERRLNAAAGPLRASRGEDVEVRGVDGDPVIALAGKPEALLEVSEDDAAAYNEDWTRLGGKGGPVTRGRLALWWGALARDLVLMLVRGEAPRHAAGLAPEGRVLLDVYEAARQTGRFGIPRSVVEGARPATRDALRILGLRVPAAVAGPPSPGGAAAPAAGVAGLRLDGVWTGTENDGEGQKFVTVTFSGTGGSLAYQRALSVSVPLSGVEQPLKGAVRYSVKMASGTRFYVGRWDGQRISGSIFSDAAATVPIGSFEIAPER